MLKRQEAVGFLFRCGSRRLVNRRLADGSMLNTLNSEKNTLYCYMLYINGNKH